MDTFELIKYQDAITTGEAVLACHALVKRYNRIFENIIRIKSENPVGDESQFSRSQSSSTELLKDIKKVLREFDHHVAEVESHLLEQQKLL